jgi:CRISPR-associated protein Cmr4
MFKKAGILFLYTETPLHPGSGASLGLADLPIQREKITNLPIMQPSGLKGVFRDFISEREGLNQIARELAACKAELAERKNNANKAALEGKIGQLEKDYKQKLQSSGIQAVFGPETSEADTHGGALSFTEARIILFPVRSLVGVFAWVTCPQALARLRRDLGVAGVAQLSWDIPPQPEKGQAWITGASTVKSEDNNIVLEEYAFIGQVSEDAEKIAEWLATQAFPTSNAHTYWKTRLYENKNEEVFSNLVILRDEDFRDFTLFGTEVITRIRIDPTKGTVAKGALWTEEHLPTDTLLYTLALAADPRVADGQLADHLRKDGKGSAEKVLEYLAGRVGGQLVQMGGDATVGRGLVHVRVHTKQDK